MKKLCSVIFFLLSIPIVLFAQKTVCVNLSYWCDGKPLQTNNFCYANSLGTTYQVNELQFFLSNMAICVDGKWITESIQITKSGDSQKQYVEPYYFDSNESYQQNYIAFNVKKQKTTVDSVRFTFGLPRELNVPYSLRDSKLARMYWPEVLGGGYHYMKLNLKFVDSQDSISLFNCHLGRGVVEDVFVDNDFTVTLPTDGICLNSEKNFVEIRMNVDKWFSGPNPIDFNLYTKGIMGNQEVMGKILENGKSAFQISCN